MLKRMILFVSILLLLALSGCQEPGSEELEPSPEVEQVISEEGEALPNELDLIPGAYFGTFYGQAASSLRLYEQIGKMPAISAVYLGWSGGFPGGLATANARVGRITFVTWEYTARPGDSYAERTLDAITDGVYDEYLSGWAEMAAAFGEPIFLRWGHEMNGDWYLWGGENNGAGQLDGYGDPTQADGPERFVAAYRYIHDLFTAEGAENVLWVWCPTAPFSTMDYSYGSDGWNAAENYYPGDEYVDWLCFDGYNWGTSSFGQSFNSRWESFDEIFQESYQRLITVNATKPIIIGEFASTEDGGDKAAWVEDAFQKLESEYPNIKAIIWFHIAKETDWRMDSSPESLEAFQEVFEGDIYWLEAWPDFID